MNFGSTSKLRVSRRRVWGEEAPVVFRVFENVIQANLDMKVEK